MNTDKLISSLALWMVFLLLFWGIFMIVLLAQLDNASAYREGETKDAESKAILSLNHYYQPLHNSDDSLFFVGVMPPLIDHFNDSLFNRGKDSINVNLQLTIVKNNGMSEKSVNSESYYYTSFGRINAQFVTLGYKIALLVIVLFLMGAVIILKSINLSDNVSFLQTLFPVIALGLTILTTGGLLSSPFSLPLSAYITTTLLITEGVKDASHKRRKWLIASFIAILLVPYAYTYAFHSTFEIFQWSDAPWITVIRLLATFSLLIISGLFSYAISKNLGISELWEALRNAFSKKRRESISSRPNGHSTKDETVKIEGSSNVS